MTRPGSPRPGAEPGREEDDKDTPSSSVSGLTHSKLSGSSPPRGIAGESENVSSEPGRSLALESGSRGEAKARKCHVSLLLLLLHLTFC